MRLISRAAKLDGSVRIPGSKSHTIRALILGALAKGQSIIREPLESQDTRSGFAAVRAMGAEIADYGTHWAVTGIGGAPRACGQLIDVGNSGTTLYIALAVAALAERGEIRFDGDAQIRRRSAKNLLASLRDLGATIDSAENGCCPITVKGPLTGGVTTIECPTSQYLSALLIAAPLAKGDTEIRVPLLFEQPYVEMTLQWIRSLGVTLEHAPDYSHFRIPGGQNYKAFDRTVAADFSSATFFLCAAAALGSELLVQGLDLSDTQGDKAVIDYLRAMGARIEQEEGGVRVMAGEGLRGAELDLNATPDALPAMAVAAAVAKGRTVLGNVPQARIKETDRIAVMAAELKKLGVAIEEKPDGLVIDGGTIRGGEVGGHGDHRVVMAMAVAGLLADAPVTVDTAEAAAVTFPTFAQLMASIGAKIEIIDGE